MYHNQIIPTHIKQVLKFQVKKRLSFLISIYFQYSMFSISKFESFFFILTNHPAAVRCICNTRMVGKKWGKVKEIDNGRSLEVVCPRLSFYRSSTHFSYVQAYGKAAVTREHRFDSRDPYLVGLVAARERQRVFCSSIHGNAE